MSSGNKIPLERAHKWAARVAEILSPNCERVEIAGSIRRQQPSIGDIEIVCIPHRNYDLLGAASGVSAGFAATLDKWQAIRGSAEGRYTQRVLPNTNGFTVDIFMADADNWGWIYALRTGSAEFVQRVILRGLRDHNCFAEDGYIYDYTDTLCPAKCALPDEIDLFKLISVDFIEPEDRNIESF